MKRKVTFNDNGQGTINARIVIPAEFVSLLGITQEEREVDITFKEKSIIIKKHENK